MVDINPSIPQRLEFTREAIEERFASFIERLRDAVVVTGASLQEFKLYLLGISALENSHAPEMPIVLDNVKTQIENAASINDIFIILTTDSSSFINIGIFQCIIDKYEINTDSDDDLQYSEHLKAYLHNREISEFSFAERVSKSSEEFIIKLNFALHNITEILALKINLAKILGIRSCTIRLFGIEKDCEVVTFLIPTTVANYLFGTGLTEKQEVEILALAIKVLSCGNYKLEKISCDDTVPALSASSEPTELTDLEPIIYDEYPDRELKSTSPGPTELTDLELITHEEDQEYPDREVKSTSPGPSDLEPIHEDDQEYRDREKECTSQATSPRPTELTGLEPITHEDDQEYPDREVKSTSPGPIELSELEPTHEDDQEYVDKEVKSTSPKPIKLPELEPTHEDDQEYPDREEEFTSPIELPSLEPTHEDGQEYPDREVKSTLSEPIELPELEPTYEATSPGPINHEDDQKETKSTSPEPVKQAEPELSYKDTEPKSSIDTDSSSTNPMIKRSYPLLMEDRFVGDFHGAAKTGDLQKARDLLEKNRFSVFGHYVECKDINGQTPLFYACSQGHLEMVQMLTSEFSADRTVKDKLGRTVAMVAALGGHGKVVEALMGDRKYASWYFNQKDHQGRMLLHYACASGDRSMVQTLIRICESIIKAFCEDGCKAQLCLAVIKAASSGDEDLVVSLLNKEIINYPDNVIDYTFDSDTFKNLVLKHRVLTSRDARNDTPLHVAASCGHREVVLMLIDEFECEPSIRGHLSQNLLHSACSGGNATLVKDLIVKYRVEINAEDAQNDTPLHVAALCGHKEVVLMLINELNCELTVKGHFGRTLLHSACSGGNATLVKALIIKHNLDINAQDNQDDTPLHVAASCGHGDLVLMLINELKSELNVRGHLGRTLLHSACSGGNVTLVKALIADHSKDFNVRDAQNDTPLHVAASCGHCEMVLQLINQLECEVNVTGHLGRTLLHSACTGGSVKLVQTLIVDYKASINAVDELKYSPLQVAVLYDQKEVALALICDLFKASTSLLHIACSVGNLDMVQALLLAHRETINDLDFESNTPLHVAALWGQEKVFSLLVNKFGADVMVAGHLERSLLHSACIGGNINIVKTLVLVLNAPICAWDSQHNTPLDVAGNKLVFRLISGRVVQTLVEKSGALYCENDSPLVYLFEVLLNSDHSYDISHLDVCSLLQFACSRGFVGLAKMLILNHKADITVLDKDSNTPLHLAALCGKSEVISTILTDFDINYDINTRGHLGRTLLHCACSEGHVRLVKILLSHEACVTLPDDDGNTPLHVAALCGHTEVISTIVSSDHGYDINTRGHHGWSLLHCACSEGHLSLVKILLSHKACVTLPDDDGNTPLYVAALCGHSEELSTIVSSDHSYDINTRGHLGRSLLHCACSKGHLNLAQSLINDHKADVCMLDHESNTPLHVAALCGHRKIVLMLINEFKCEFNIRGHLGQSVLHSACSGGNATLVRDLIDAHNLDINARDTQNDTPLHVAASCGHKEVVLMLIHMFKCELNVRGHLGRTVLHSACSGGNVTLVKALIVEHNLDINAQDTQNDTPLHVAASYGHGDLVLMLINELKSEFNVRGHLDRTLLHSACSGGNVTLVKALISDHGENFNVRDAQNDTPLHVAASCGHWEVVLMLLNELKCEVNVRGHLGQTLLHNACIVGSVGLVQTLIVDYKASVIVVDELKYSPLQVAVLYDQKDVALALINNVFKTSTSLLHIACSVGNLDIVQAILLDHRETINDLDFESNTPLHVAALWGQEKVFSLLVNKFGADVKVAGHLGRSLLHSACIGGNINIVKTLVLVLNAPICVWDSQHNTPLDVAGNKLVFRLISGRVVQTLVEKSGALYGENDTSLVYLFEVLLNSDYSDDLNHLDICSLLQFACSRGNISLVKMLILNHKADITVLDKDSNTPLHLAALSGKCEVISTILTDFDFNYDINTKGHLGRSLLHCACSEGHVSLVKILLSHNACVTLPDDDGNTPLHVAALCGHSEVITTIVSSDCSYDINTKGHLGKSLLHCACSKGHLNLAQNLINDHKADVCILDHESNTPLHVAALCGHRKVVLMLINEWKYEFNVGGHLGRSVLHSACSGGNATLVKDLIDTHNLDINARDAQNDTPLHVAASCGHREVVLMLIDKFKFELNVRGHLGRTVLHSACSGGNSSLVNTLIVDYNADICVCDDQKYTPLQVAVLCNHQEIAQALVADFYVIKIVTSLLHMACSVGNLSMVESLLLTQQVASSSSDGQGNTPLHVAALWGEEEVLYCLIDKFDADVTIAGHLGRSLLHSACIGGNINIVKILILKHKASVNARDVENSTPFHVAALYGQEKVCSILISDFEADVNVRDEQNNTPLHVAALYGQDKVISILFGYFDINTQGHLGRSLLHCACIGGHIALVQTLILDHKADLNALDDEGNTPLHVAALGGQEKVITTVLNDFDWDINTRGHLGRSLLHCACSKGFLNLVQALILDYKADVQLQDVNGSTPLYVAALCGHEEVIFMLMNQFDISGDQAQLYNACSTGLVNLVLAIVGRDANSIYMRDGQNNTPLHVSALSGQERVITAVLNEFDFDINTRGHLGRSILHCACSEGHVSLVQTLILDHKADLQLSDDENNTPLHVAALYGQSKVVLMMVNKFKCNGRGHLNRTLLHSACSGGNVTLVEALIIDHSLDINARDAQNNTPLHVAASCGHKEVVLMVINRSMDMLNVRGYLNRTVLHSACSGGNATLVKALIAMYNADINARDAQNDSPLHVAASCGHRELVLMYSYDHVRGNLGRTLLHIACSRGYLDLVCALVERNKTSYIYTQDDQNNTPLHLAALYGQDEVISTLVSDFDINTKGQYGRTLLHCACSGGHLHLVQTLVHDRKADICPLDAEDNTPLHLAALHGREEIVLVLLDKFGCDPTVRGYQGRSLLHSACIGGNVDIVKRIYNIMDTLLVDFNGNTPLHTSAALGWVGCVEVLLTKQAPILMRNNSGNTPIDVATGEARVFLQRYTKEHKDSIYQEYDIIQKKAKVKYSGAKRITRIFVIGNPGAGKSSLIETLKRENLLDFFRTVSDSDVPRHTAGIIPSIHRSKHYGRVLFYDFAGDPEYYSSHAAILESVASSDKGDNIFIVVVNLNEDDASIRDIIAYWVRFIQNQGFDERRSSFTIVGSHLDTLSRDIKNKKSIQFKAICTESAKQSADSLRFSCFMLNCCRPPQVADIQKHVVSLTKGSPRHKLSLHAILLLGLLEKDFGHVVSCTIQSIISHIKETGINLPSKVQSIYSILCELQDIGLLLVVACSDFDLTQVVLNVSKLTNDVHRLLFSKSAAEVLQPSISGIQSCKPVFNVGIIPQNVLKESLPEHITKECLVQLQYCQEISHDDISAFPNASFPDIASQSFLFFPALCTAQKNEVSLKSDVNVKYSVGWIAQCTDNCFPPRFLHVLLLRLVFKFTLSAPSRAADPSEHNVFHRRCTMWTTGVHWLMEEGVECMVEVVKASKAVVAVIKGEDENFAVFAKIIDCVIASTKRFCHNILYDTFFLDSTNEDDYFNEDNMFAESDLNNILAHPQGKTVTLSVSGTVASSRLLHIYKQLKIHKDMLVANHQLPLGNGTDFAGYVSSLPPAVHPHLDHQLDQDSEEDTDLAEIAHHMLDWEQKLLTYLKLTEEDRREIQDQHSTPELQSCEVLRRWKKNQMPHATYGNLLQVFVDSGHTQCAEALCEILRKKCPPSIKDKPDLYHLIHLKIVQTVASRWEHVASILRLSRFVVANIRRDTVNFGCEHSCHMTFCKWLDGEGCRPITWEKLIEALSDAEYGELAENLEHFFTSNR